MSYSFFKLGFLSLPSLLLIGSVLTAPLAGPPLPLDPALSAIAPENCILYASSSGVAEADPASPNQTEKLYAEAEVRNLIDGLRDQVLAALKKNTAGDQDGEIISAMLPKLFAALLRRPTAAYIEDLTLSNEGFQMQAGLVVNAGDQKTELEAALTTLVDLAVEKGTPIGTIKNQDGTWHVMRLSMQTPELRFGWHNDYLIFAVGDSVSEDIKSRLDGGKSPAWLDTLRSDDGAIQRESSLFHLDIQLLLEKLKPQIDRGGGWPVVEKLGLTGLQSLVRRAGFDELGCASHAKLNISGPRRGLLEFIPDRPLSDNDLRLIPENSMLAAAVRFDLADAWKNLIRIGKDFDPQGIDRIEENMRKAEEKLGFHIEDDLIGSLDDVLLAYMPEGDLMSAAIGSAFAAKVKDAPRLRKSIDAWIADIRAKMPAGGRGPQFTDYEFEGQKIYGLSGVPMPITPSWCITDDWFFFAFNQQTIRSMISRKEEPSIAGAPSVKEAFTQRKAPTAIVFVDTPKVTRAAYPFVQMGLTMMTPQLRQAGIEFDPSILPSSGAIVPHLRPFVGTMAAGSDGPVFRSQHSFPGGNGATALAPMSFALLGAARTVPIAASRGSRNINNVRQIALGVLNYESTYGKLPGNIYGDDGKALLSWRVRLLPFLDQQALYNRFKLDEPWDSEHNKPLSEIVIQTFQTPGGPTDGRTCYLALAGEETLFPGEKEIGLRDVTDGTSNTILCVQAANDQAVPWSKPQDLDFDAEQPLRGLKKGRSQFGVAMNDGSCRTLNTSIDAEVFKAMATRAGGERISIP